MRFVSCAGMVGLGWGDDGYPWDSRLAKCRRNFSELLSGFFCTAAPVLAVSCGAGRTGKGMVELRQFLVAISYSRCGVE